MTFQGAHMSKPDSNMTRGYGFSLAAILAAIVHVAVGLLVWRTQSKSHLHMGRGSIDLVLYDSGWLICAVGVG